MNILVVSQFYYPDDFRINDVTKALAADGHRVLVVTGLPDYATGRVPKPYRFFRRRRETLDGVSVVRTPIVARRKGVFFRALNYLSFVISGSLYALFTRFRADVVFSCETSPVLQTLPAIVYQKRRRVPLVLYCCDIWPECLKVWNVRESDWLFRRMHTLSRYIYRQGDIVPISSPPFRAYLREVNGIPDDKMVELPQHAEDLYSGIAGQYEENGCADFLFAGNIGAAQQVDCLIRAVSLIQTERPFCVHIVGDGSERAACEELVEHFGLRGRVIFHGKHPLSEMEPFYRLADCFVLTMMGGGVGDATLPAKIQGYLSAGKPIVGAADGISARMIEEAGCGVCVPADDSVALAQAMTAVLERPAAFREMGLRGRRYYEANYTKEIFMKRLYAILEQVQGTVSER